MAVASTTSESSISLGKLKLDWLDFKDKLSDKAPEQCCIDCQQVCRLLHSGMYRVQPAWWWWCQCVAHVTCSTL
jgi:hypothetical protein